MYRSVGAGIALLFVATVAFSAKKPPPERNASVKLWLDTSATHPCEQSRPASGGWIVHNNEGRNVTVTVRRTFISSGATREDEMSDLLGPRESRELGCELSEDGRQSLILERAVY